MYFLEKGTSIIHARHFHRSCPQLSVKRSTTSAFELSRQNPISMDIFFKILPLMYGTLGILHNFILIHFSHRFVLWFFPVEAICLNWHPIYQTYTKSSQYIGTKSSACKNIIHYVIWSQMKPLKIIYKNISQLLTDIFMFLQRLIQLHESDEIC